MLRVRFISILLSMVVITAAGAIAADDVSVQEAAVTIEAGKKGEPISKYIFGQFIEHQGRCIYGGIWAEMLDDRKFYYNIDDEKSPWKPICPEQTVTMVTENSYVGEHTPQVRLDGQRPCGIVQSELALRKGRKYEGHIRLAGSGSIKIQVSLVWGQGQNDRQTITINHLFNEYTKTSFHFTAGGDTDNGRFEITGVGDGSFNIGVVSLMPADNIHGMRADALMLIKELGGTVYRWPGGLFASEYDWRKGIGERDKRTPMINWSYFWPEAGWSEIYEMNDFGVDEFMLFCNLLNAEAYIVVNAGYGDEYSAAAFVEYTNGSVNTPMGSLRAANGHQQPYNVKFWGVGNEMWQFGFMALMRYVRKHNMFAEAMRKADPSITLIGVGGIGHNDQWSEGMLRDCAENMDLISEHFYAPEGESVVEHIKNPPKFVRSHVAEHLDYRERLESLKGKDIRLALDEWNYFWYSPQLYGDAAPRYYFKDALGIAAGLHEMFRNTNIIAMANTHPINVHGHVKTNKTGAALEATGLVLKIYSRHFEKLPVAVAGDTDPLDISAAMSEDGNVLTIGIVNPTEDKYELAIDLKDAKLSGAGQLWLISHCDPMAYNEPGKTPQVVIEEKPLLGISNELSVSPLSINIYKLAVR